MSVVMLLSSRFGYAKRKGFPAMHDAEVDDIGGAVGFEGAYHGLVGLGISWEPRVLAR